MLHLQLVKTSGEEAFHATEDEDGLCHRTTKLSIHALAVL
jgi:hypothetical protein